MLEADRHIQAGVGFGAAEHSVKALQIALSGDSLGSGADEHGRIPGYNISFNFARCTTSGSGHPYSGSKCGMYLGPDGRHEGDHDGPCREKFGGISKCPQLTAVNLIPQNHSKNMKHQPSVNGMTFDTFTFSTTLINELENSSINRGTCNLAVESITNHTRDYMSACCAEVWICGRCFCASPLMRSFDAFGKLRITRLSMDRSNAPP